MDDARIFCTENNDEGCNDNVEQKARTLASLSVLQCWKRAMIPSVELKSVVYTYLDCTKMKIDHLFDTILSQHSAGLCNSPTASLSKHYAFVEQVLILKVD